MTGKTDRLRVLLAPDHPERAAGEPRLAGTQAALTGLPRTIRRCELHMIVPLSDTTIYDMEIRGEFPRRFYLTPRSVVWDLSEVEAWLKQRRADSDAGRVRKAAPPDVRLRKTRPMKDR